MPTEFEKTLDPIQRAISRSGEFTAEEIEKFMFHLRDGADDINNLLSISNDSMSHGDEAVMKILINFFIHVPAHLKSAADILLKEPSGNQ